MRKTLLLLLVAVPLHAQLRLPHVLSDHMVLQRDAPIHLWGWAAPAERIRIALNDGTAETTADHLGKWSAFLQPQHAGGPYDLTVQGNSTVMLHDIMLGDLWIASGQSNMEMGLQGFTGAPMKDSAKEIAAATHPELRLLTMPHHGADFPQNDADVTWTRCTPESAKDFSAVAYFFGREIAAKEHVAIGLIDTTWGGTPLETWTGFDAFGSNPALAPIWEQWSRFAAEQTDYPEILAEEKRDDEQRKAAGQQPVKHPWHPPGEAYRPASLFNGMIAPFTPLTIRGVIWYQGETNSRLDRAVVYHTLFRDMIGSWRRNFAQGPFPFLFVQISSFRSSPQEDWGTLRDAQRRTLEVANTAMAVTLDIGQADNVHPPDKQTVGHRLVLAARALSYGEPGVHYAGPLFARADVEGSAIRVGFHDRTTRLTCRSGPCIGFEVAGEDHNFAPAEAVVENTSVVVKSSAVPQPRYVRYAWPNAPEANLVDAEGLPTSTFTSEKDVQERGPKNTSR